MPRDSKRKGLFRTSRKIRDNFDLLDNGLRDIYQTTYSNSKDNLDSAEKIRNDIDDQIDSIMTNTFANSSVGNMTKLYTKMALKKAQGNKDVIKSLEDTFNDETMTANILTAWMENKWIKDLEYEIDMVLKYMPRLREALECKKDLVLSADHFSKDFINYHNITSKGREEIFNRRMEELKKVYKLDEEYEKWYDHTQTYGETFVYVAPYSREFEKLLKAKKDSVYQSLGESFNLIEHGRLGSGIKSIDNGANLINVLSEMGLQDANISVTINKSGLLASSAQELSRLRETSRIKSMSEIFSENVDMLREDKKLKIDDHLIPDELQFDDKTEDEKIPGEMLIDASGKKESKEKVSVPGCIVKMLESSNVIPIYIEDTCLGYYYIEFTSNDITFDDPNSFEYSAGLNTMGSSGRLARNIDKMQQQNRDKMIGYIAQQLSSVIDANFINNNQELRRELFQILKHTTLLNNPTNSVNGNITITFLAAEDVTHMYFKKDPVTKRGISDIAYSMFPAKLYASMYITDVLGTITRGQDKRVYYVKQSVETNISKTLLNVLNQIKRGNFGARQMENLGNILNITGRFNDYLIPLSPGGDPPVQFDIMPGQQFTDNSELMNRLEKMAIDPTDIPYDLIEARQSLDYAIQATMSNSKLMRNIYKRQDATEIFFSNITSKIYDYEYNEDESIDISLPAPSFLNMTNGAQLIEGTMNYINTIAQSELAGMDEEVQNEFRKIAMRYYIPTHMNISKINEMINQAKMAVVKNKANQSENEE